MDSTFSSFLSMSRLFGTWWIIITLIYIYPCILDERSMCLMTEFEERVHISFWTILGSVWSLQASQGCLREVTGSLHLESFSEIFPLLFSILSMFGQCHYVGSSLTGSHAPPAVSWQHVVGKVRKNLNSVGFCQMQEASVDRRSKHYLSFTFKESTSPSHHHQSLASLT